MDSGGGSTKATAAGGDEKPPGDSGGRHHHIYLHQSTRIMLLVVAVTLSCLVLYHTAYPFEFFPSSFRTSYANVANNSSSSSSAQLEKVLKKAAMGEKNKTVIITTLNDAWAEPGSIFDLFLESFRIGNQTQRLLSHVVVVALDQKAYNRCMELHTHCYYLITTTDVDLSSEKGFMSPDYLKMMWMRIDFLRLVLEIGYDFVFTDVDIMWFRDPFQHFDRNTDFEIACDYFKGNPTDLNNLPNGGFTYVKSNTRTTHFYRFWYASRETYPGLHDQDVFNRIKWDPYLIMNGIQIKFLDTAFFGGICEPSRDLNLVCTMHVNCCVGLDNKIYDLRLMLDDWRKYISKFTNQRKSQGQTSWTVPQRCGAASFRPRDPPKANDTRGK